MPKEINPEKVQNVVMNMAIGIHLKKEADANKEDAISLAYKRACADYMRNAGMSLKTVISGEASRFTKCAVSILEYQPWVSLATLDEGELKHYKLEGTATQQYALLMSILQ